MVLAGDIDRLQVDLSDGFQLATKIVIAVFLFGVALDVRPADFRDVVRRPLAIGAGLLAQYAVMPVLTLLLTLALDVRGSVAIGMILVVCCPAGNLSNILTHRARGDVALSISLTTASNGVAIVLTPVAVAFWCGLNPAADDLMRDVAIDAWGMVAEVALLIGLPFALGLLVAWRLPRFSARARRYVEPGALVLLLLIVVGGLAGQFAAFRGYVGAVALAIVLQNALSLGVGYGTGRAPAAPRAGGARDDVRARRAQHRPGPGARAGVLRRPRRGGVRGRALGPVGRDDRPGAVDLVEAGYGPRSTCGIAGEACRAMTPRPSRRAGALAPSDRSNSAWNCRAAASAACPRAVAVIARTRRSPGAGTRSTYP